MYQSYLSLINDCIDFYLHGPSHFNLTTNELPEELVHDHGHENEIKLLFLKTKSAEELDHVSCKSLQQPKYDLIDAFVRSCSAEAVEEKDFSRGLDSVSLPLGQSEASLSDIRLTDIGFILIVSVLFFHAKRSIANLVSRSNFLKSLQLRPKDHQRLEENVWRLIYYFCSSAWLVYSCFIKNNSYSLFSSKQALRVYSFELQTDEYLICIIEISFYLHATYALIYEDVWRRDSLMMLLHHLVAIFSVLWIYALRMHKIGLIAVVLRDTCDVLLEVVKLFSSLRIQNGRVMKRMETVLMIVMPIFTITFVVNQLYYYPLYCLYHGKNILAHNRLQLTTSMITSIVTCSLTFLALDIFWFLLILRLLYRVVFAGAPMEDEREYDCISDEKLTGKQKAIGKLLKGAKWKSE